MDTSKKSAVLGGETLENFIADQVERTAFADPGTAVLAVDSSNETWVDLTGTRLDTLPVTGVNYVSGIGDTAYTDFTTPTFCNGCDYSLAQDGSDMRPTLQFEGDVTTDLGNVNQLLVAFLDPANLPAASWTDKFSTDDKIMRLECVAGISIPCDSLARGAAASYSAKVYAHAYKPDGTELTLTSSGSVSPAQYRLLALRVKYWVQKKTSTGWTTIVQGAQDADLNLGYVSSSPAKASNTFSANRNDTYRTLVTGGVKTALGTWYWFDQIVNGYATQVGHC